nr:RNA-directed DNA polymerase, eukaryota [Tanacetum cinerariifolium]
MGQTSSYANVVNGQSSGVHGSLLSSSPALVLDDSCLIRRNLLNHAMGKVKEFSSIPNLYTILHDEGFSDIKLTYLGGLWVLIELDKLETKEALKNHNGMKSWFQAANNFDPFPNDNVVESEVEYASDNEGVPETVFGSYSSSLKQDNRDTEESQVLATRQKKVWIKELATSHELNFLAIQETKLSNVSHMDVKLMWGNSNYDYVCSDSLGNSGGILCIWDASIFKKDNLTISDNFIAIYGTWLPGKSKILFVIVYAPQPTSCKRILWDYLLTLVGRWNGETIIMGDFNEVRSINERCRSCFNPYSARLFDHFISNSGLVDVNLDGYAFTWSHPSASNMSKLHRFLISCANNFDPFPNDNVVESEDEYVSDNEGVPETVFGSYSSSLKQDNRDTKESQSKDPFEIYDLLNKKPDDKCIPSPSLSHPPGFTLEVSKKHADIATYHNATTYVSANVNAKVMNTSQEVPVESLSESVGKHIINNGGSVLGVMEDIIRVRQIMGYTMEGCAKDLEAIIGQQGDMNETKLSNVSHMDVKLMWGNSNYDYVCSDSLGNSGGILCIWEALIFKKDNLTISDNFIAIHGTWLPIRWDYLFDVLEAFGFGHTWCKWIQGILRYGRASILVNGSPSKEFSCHRGLKQGGNDNLVVNFVVNDNDLRQRKQLDERKIWLIDGGSTYFVCFDD